MIIKNSKVNKEYKINKIIYENPENGVICGLAYEREAKLCFVKTISYGGLSKQDVKYVKDMAEREANSIRKAKICSEKVPKLIDYIDDKKNERIVIVMEKMKGTTLREWMEAKPLTKVTSKDLFLRSQIVKQVAEILWSINRKNPGIVHRDLKPENIFIAFNEENHRWEVSIVDFGCASLNHIRNVGTANYQSPEQQKRYNMSVAISHKTDVFALGKIFYELLTGYLPKQGIDYRIKQSETKWNTTPELPDDILRLEHGATIHELIKSMTAFSVDDRCGYDRIVGELKFKSKIKSRRKQ